MKSDRCHEVRSTEEILLAPGYEIVMLANLTRKGVITPSGDRVELLEPNTDLGIQGLIVPGAAFDVWLYELVLVTNVSDKTV